VWVTLSLIVATLILGIFVATTHTQTDFNDSNRIENYEITYFLTKDEFPEEVVGDVLSHEKVLDTASQNENENGNISFSDAVMRELSSATYIVVATSEGKVHNYSGTLIQEVTLDKVIRGADSLKIGETISLSMNSCGFIPNQKIYYGTYCNIMAYKKKYLIFMNNIDNMIVKSRGYYEACNINLLPYFCIENIENNIGVINEDYGITYGDESQNEFFVGDEFANIEVLLLKKTVLMTYLKNFSIN
jgi:hypothetical protein